MFGQAEAIGHRIDTVIFIPEGAVVQAEGLMKVGNDQSDAYFFDSLAGQFMCFLLMQRFALT